MHQKEQNLEQLNQETHFSLLEIVAQVQKIE